MAEFVVGVIGNVLRHVAIEELEGGDIGRRATGIEWQIDLGERRVIALGLASQLRILLPEVLLDAFYGLQEAQNGGISFREPA